MPIEKQTNDRLVNGWETIYYYIVISISCITIESDIHKFSIKKPAIMLQNKSICVVRCESRLFWLISFIILALMLTELPCVIPRECTQLATWAISQIMLPKLSNDLSQTSQRMTASIVYFLTTVSNQAYQILTTCENGCSERGERTPNSIRVQICESRNIRPGDIK